jgi:hypothetical protein
VKLAVLWKKCRKVKAAVSAQKVTGRTQRKKGKIRNMLTGVDFYDWTNISTNLNLMKKLQNILSFASLWFTIVPKEIISLPC